MQEYLELLDQDKLFDLGISQEQLNQSLHDFMGGILALMGDKRLVIKTEVLHRLQNQARRRGRTWPGLRSWTTD